MPRHFADLCKCLRGDGLTETREPTARVDRSAAADRRVAVMQKSLGLAGLAEADVLVPVELERAGQVVDLRE